VHNVKGKEVLDKKRTKVSKKNPDILLPVRFDFKKKKNEVLVGFLSLP